MLHGGCLHQPHPALAYCSLATCPRESLWRAVCHTAVESAPPSSSQPMNAKREMVCQKLHLRRDLPARSHAHQQHNTNYDSDGSESDSTWGACGPVSVLSNLCERLADLNGGHPFKDDHSFKDGFFISKSGQKFGLHFVQPLQILKMGEGCGKSALAHSPQR